MEVKECNIINPSSFIQAVYKYAKDRNKLKFYKDGTLNFKVFEDKFASQLEKYGGELKNKVELDIKVLEKDNSYLDEDIFFPFVISTVRKSKNKKSIERVRIKYIGG